MTGDHIEVNYVGNYIRPGPDSKLQHGIIVFTDTADAKYYLSGNMVEGNKAATKSNEMLFDRTEFSGKRLVTRVPRQFEAPPVKTSGASAAFKDVLRGVGATRPARDSVDQRIIEIVRKNNGRIIDSTDQVGGWPEYRTGVAPKDSDGDGMPDEWEIRHHLNPNDPTDANQDQTGDGYTNIEKYLEQAKE